MTEVLAQQAVFDGSQSQVPYDNLRRVMRMMYYETVRIGYPANMILASVDALIAYEERCEQNDPATTTFKGVPVRVDFLLRREMIFLCGDQHVGRIRNIT
jgi:hypothetical protein